MANRQPRKLRDDLPHELSLAGLRPDVAEEWHPANAYGPEQITPNSRRVVLWQCYRGHEYTQQIRERCRAKIGCTACKYLLVDPSRSIAALRPDVAEWWHPGLNDGIGPEDLSLYSERLVCWMCPEGHEYSMCPRHMTRAKTVRCPICTGSSDLPDLHVGIPVGDEDAPACNLPWLWVKQEIRPRDPRRPRLRTIQEGVEVDLWRIAAKVSP